jgi:hypothetical protein
MGKHGVQGAKRRGKPWRTTRPDPQARRRPDLVQRHFTAARPNELHQAALGELPPAEFEARNASPDVADQSLSITTETN